MQESATAPCAAVRFRLPTRPQASQPMASPDRPHDVPPRGSLLRPLLLGLFLTAGILASGWGAGQLPTRVTARATIQRQYRPRDREGIAMSTAALTQQFQDSRLLQGVLLEVGYPAAAINLATATRLAQQVSVRRQPQSEEGDELLIEFSCSRPEVARHVLPMLVTRFLEQAQRTHEQRDLTAELTRAQGELAGTRKQWERARAEWRELPAADSAATLAEREERLRQVRESIANVEQEGTQLHALANDPRVIMPATPALTTATRHEEETMARLALQQCQQQRDELAATFTDKHPAVINLDYKIRQLAERCGIAEMAGGNAPQPVGFAQNVSTPESQLRQRLAAVDRQLHTLRGQEAQCVRECEGARSRQTLRDRLREQMTALESACTQRQQRLDSYRDMLRALTETQRVTYTASAQAPVITAHGPNRRLWFAMGTVASLLATCGLGLLGRRRV